MDELSYYYINQTGYNKRGIYAQVTCNDVAGLQYDVSRNEYVDDGYYYHYDVTGLSHKN